MNVPTLTTEQERIYLYELVRNSYTGRGAIVEVGTWFGASAAYLARGLADAGVSGKLYCIDRFSLDESDIATARAQGFTQDVHVGVDMVPSVSAYVRQYYTQVNCIKTYIQDMSWSYGPIEILHLDAPKRWVDVVHVLNTFQHALIPGVSRVVLQDFCVPSGYALPLIMSGLAHSFVFESVPCSQGTTVTCIYQGPFTTAHLDIRQWDIQIVVDRMYAWKKYLSIEQQQLLDIGLALYCIDTGEYDMFDLLSNQLLCRTYE